jgi:ectoine hydroxylase-related dioxygenase (phytanoyl-CoA dioxygenase family)
MILTPEQIDTFHREGYLVVEALFGDADLQPVIDEITAEIERRATELVAAGELSRSYAEEGFETRLTRVTAETEKLYWSICSGQLAGPGLFGLLAHPRLLDLAEDLMGPEIIASSAYRVRPKIPGFPHGVVPWHQDSGYFEPYCDRSLILTVWIPLVDATPERGCLQVIPRVHRGPVARHFSRPDLRYLIITEEDLPAGEVVTVPVRKGGALLLTNRTPHCSIDNTVDVVRWSLDFRYQSAGLPTNARAADETPLFTPEAEGVPVACYPPEADFVVRSRARPEDVVTSWERFHAIRTGHAPASVTSRWQRVEAPPTPQSWGE